MKNVVIIETSDNKIWNLDKKIIEICKFMHLQMPFVINLNNEGPCCIATNLYSILDDLCTIFSFDKHSITIKTSNLLENHCDYIIKKSLNHFIDEVKIKTVPVSNKIFDNKFKHFGLFIGRQTWPRAQLAAYLYKNYCENTLMTYHFSQTNDFYRKHPDLDALVDFTDLNTLQEVTNFLQDTPIYYSEKVEGRIFMESTYNIGDAYQHFFLEIICETYFSGNTFFPTEKTWRAIANKTPFIIHGPVNYLHNLKKLGFMTFEKWWTEQYNDGNFLPIDCESTWSVIEIKNLIDLLAKKSISELEELYKDMKPVLDHNYNLMQKLTGSEILEKFTNEQK